MSRHRTGVRWTFVQIGDILILSGLPGAGKTHYAKSLERQGWARLESDKVDKRTDALAEGFKLAVPVNLDRKPNDRPLLAAASGFKGLVIEWGFRVDHLPLVEAMAARGYDAWYFDGDWRAAYQGWRARESRRPPDERQPDVNWFNQTAALERAWLRIRALYGSNVISTVLPGPTYLTESEIDRLLGLSLVRGS